MPIIKPESATFHRSRQTSTLHFRQEDGKYTSEECTMRGGICWPMAIRQGGRERIEGYAVMLGKNIKTGCVTIYEETPFVCIDHIIDSTGRIKYEGVSPWFNRCWTQYWCSKFYWRDRSATYERYMRELRRSPMIKPKPQLPEVIWDEASEINHIMAKLAMQGQLVADAKLGFIEQQQQHMVNPDQPYPARHAMMCAIAGMDQYRWNREDSDYD